MARYLWWALCAVCACALTYVVWRTWYLRKAGLRSLLFFRPCRLLSKETLVEAAEGRLPVRRFTFALPDGERKLGLDLTLGEHVKVRAAGFLPFSRSYSPVAARSGEFDLVVKIYPPAGGGKTPAHVSSHLDSLRVGDAAYVSGPFPPPPFKHMARDAGGQRTGIVAFGVGITEAFGVARGEVRLAKQVVLLWALRDRGELFAEEELQALREVGVQVMIYYSRERGRRLGPAVLLEAFAGWANSAEAAEEQRFLVVGTKAMVRETHAMLKEAGIPGRPLLTKRFGPGPAGRRTSSPHAGKSPSCSSSGGSEGEVTDSDGGSGTCAAAAATDASTELTNLSPPQPQLANQTPMPCPP